jgi:hypothetical protein
MATVGHPTVESHYLGYAFQLAIEGLPRCLESLNGRRLKR